MCAVLGGAAVAFAGSGPNGVFNLGVSNSVDAKTTLTGASPGQQLQVTDTNGGGGAFGLGVTSSSGSATGLFTNTASGTGLNADQLDGLDSAALQKRVTGTCAAGTAVQVVHSDGTVSCQAVGTGGGWSLTGNAGTTDATNFPGTSDAQPLVVKTNGSEVLRVTGNGDVGIGTAVPDAPLQVDSSSLGRRSSRRTRAGRRRPSSPPGAARRSR